MQGACTDMHRHRSQGHNSRCLVKAEENSFEYKQRALLKTIVTCTLSRRAKLSYAKHTASKAYGLCDFLGSFLSRATEKQPLKSRQHRGAACKRVYISIIIL